MSLGTIGELRVAAGFPFYRGDKTLELAVTFVQRGAKDPF